MRLKELLDGRIVFCANDHQVKIFDPTSNIITSSISIGITYDYLVINENILMTCSKDCIVRTIDLRKNSEVNRLYLDNSPVKIMSPFNNF